MIIMIIIIYYRLGYRNKTFHDKLRPTSYRNNIVYYYYYYYYYYRYCDIITIYESLSAYTYDPRATIHNSLKNIIIIININQSLNYIVYLKSTSSYLLHTYTHTYTHAVL